MERRLAKKWPRVLNRKRKKVSLWSLERLSIRFLTQVCSSLLLPLVLPYSFLKMSLLPSLFYLCTPASLVWGAFGETCSYAHTMECTPTYWDGAASEQEGCAAAASRTLHGSLQCMFDEWWKGCVQQSHEKHRQQVHESVARFLCCIMVYAGWLAGHQVCLQGCHHKCEMPEIAMC